MVSCGADLNGERRAWNPARARVCAGLGNGCKLVTMSVKEIETAVSKLSSQELAAFRLWFLEFDPKGWDLAATELEQVLVQRLAGPFEPLEADWKQRVRQTAADLRDA